MPWTLLPSGCLPTAWTGPGIVGAWRQLSYTVGTAAGVFARFSLRVLTCTGQQTAIKKKHRNPGLSNATIETANESVFNGNGL
jgi:hypothetical protein